jgi:thiosulfate dehydrogenase [quinone] large subunit
MAWVWLILRLWLGYTWLNAGWHKIGNPAWVETGEALQGFWTGAVENIASNWYRNFIQALLDAEAYTWFGKLIAYGEFLIGLALILGLFTGIAAFLGGFLNWNFIMAGTASTNGMLFLISVLLVLAWKIAGYIGLDYFALPFFGTPWPGKKVEELAEPGSSESS